MAQISITYLMTILGYLISCLGVILIVIGVFGAGRAVTTDRGQGFAGPADTIVEVIKLLPDLIISILKAPRWLLMVLFGIFLVWVGYRLSVPAWPFV